MLFLSTPLTEIFAKIPQTRHLVKFREIGRELPL